MKQSSFTKKDAIRVIVSAAKDYNNILSGKNYIFLYKNKNTNNIEYFESLFLPRNFQHLTGIEYIDENGELISNTTLFYRKCVNSQIRESEIRFHRDGTTELKLVALPLIVNFLKNAKMTAIYNGYRPKLAIDRLAGTTNFCLGFTLDSSGYYVPSSALLEDVRELSKEPYRILAILSKPATKNCPIYKDIRYVAKGVPLNNLTFSDELLKKISLEKYVEK